MNKKLNKKNGYTYCNTISISIDVFSTLTKQGKIDISDILGYEYYSIVDGSTIHRESSKYYKSSQ